MEIFEQFIERWMEEFGRAVEMFTGEKPALKSLSSAKGPSESEITPLTWWKQSARGSDGSFSIFAGASEAIWAALGEGNEAQTTFFEMLSQANQGTAAVLSAGFPTPISCQEGSIEAPAKTLKMESVRIQVTFRGTDVGQILLLVEKAAFAILNCSEPDSVSQSASRDSSVGMSGSPMMLSRLMGLQLPVSVLLGRANITIKEALRLMSGSVIELDRQVGEPVEVMVHGTVVAKGEIVSVKGSYGVRIKEVISRQDRIALHGAA